MRQKPNEVGIQIKGVRKIICQLYKSLSFKYCYLMTLKLREKEHNPHYLKYNPTIPITNTEICRGNTINFHYLRTTANNFVL